MNLSEILIHLGEERKNYYNAVSPPIIQSSNFVFDDLASFRKAFTNELGSHLYTRGNNPTVKILRQKIAALEGAEDALIFGSGVGAISSAIISCVKSGDHIVCVQSPYGWTYKLITEFLARFNVSHTFVDGTDLVAIENAIQPNTKLLFLESPNSVTFELQDLEACSKIAKKHNILTAIDNSYTSPLYQQPISLGIDIVTHTITKYLNGHSDVVAGVICSRKEIIQKIFATEYMALGGIISPSDAALVIRGMRTLEIRLKRCDESAQKVVAFLEEHPKIARVIYPFSKSFPQYELAKKQMSGAGGLFSIILKVEKIEQAEAFFAQLKRFLLAVSWGGHESLVMPFCAFHNIPGKEDSTISWKLVRLYIGLEDPDWLIEDLQQALAII